MEGERGEGVGDEGSQGGKELHGKIMGRVKEEVQWRELKTGSQGLQKRNSN
jgi:hypothetical protein